MSCSGVDWFFFLVSNKGKKADADSIAASSLTLSKSIFQFFLPLGTEHKSEISGFFPKQRISSGSAPATLASRRKFPVEGPGPSTTSKDTAKGKQSSSQVKKKVTPLLYADHA